MKNRENIAIENKAKSYDNLLAYVEEKAIEVDILSTLAFEDWQNYGSEINATLFREYEAQKRAYLNILDQFNPPFYHYVENGVVKNFEDDYIR